MGFGEKPRALHAEEAAQMAEAAGKNGKRVMFDFNNRAGPEAQALMQYVQEGTVGDLFERPAQEFVREFIGAQRPPWPLSDPSGSTGS